MVSKNIVVPLTVPEKSRDIFYQNYTKATANSGRLFLFAGDQKVEHLNKDFCGSGIAPEDADPRHLFEIASKARIGAFATNLGLIARYAGDYRNVRYVVKLNGKTDLVPTEQSDPLSRCWYSVAQIASFKSRTGLDIVGIGITVYLGSEYESKMLAAAAEAVYEAHQNGLLAIVWMYPRGKAVTDERHPDIIAGAAGVAACLGADFVKVNVPTSSDGRKSADLLRQATMAAGLTKVICSGGSSKDAALFLQDVYHQLHVGGAQGAAVGRNIHQKGLSEAIKFCQALSALILDDVDVAEAKKLLK
jgi:fructose-bisphosphate aldolase / 6-deoxy-5-ketofructose 1-phosphate synthase